ncbi:hypothetical protein MMC07_002067 [Pseudocyphellaria aurata]|nr:hypothetical protein [Pseudocyphellaria aurata]
MAESIAVVASYRTELIDYILKAPTPPTTLIICASRESFLQNLQKDVQRAHSVSLPSDENSDNPAPHRLLIPTIHLLAATRSIRLAFTPTLPHLRAYLATFESTSETDTHSASHQSRAFGGTVLVILGLVALHHSTSEYSAQGLSRSIAVAVEAAHSAGMKLIVAELRKEYGNEDSMAHNEIVNGTPHDPWNEQIPLLNGSTRSGNEERVWAGRTITIGRVVGRWCKFEALDADQ